MISFNLVSLVLIALEVCWLMLWTWSQLPQSDRKMFDPIGLVLILDSIVLCLRKMALEVDLCGDIMNLVVSATNK